VTTQQSDDPMAVIGASFGITAGLGGGTGQDGADAVADVIGLPRRPCRPFMPFNLPPGLLSATTVGSYLDLPMQFGPRAGWFWDITALTAYGFTAGAIAVTKNFPLVTSAGTAWAVEQVGSFTQAGVITFPQRGMPLLDHTERLVFTVSSALTGTAQIGGQVIAIPAERISDYVS
jgi:hypothetical protein